MRKIIPVQVCAIRPGFMAQQWRNQVCAVIDGRLKIKSMAQEHCAIAFSYRSSNGASFLSQRALRLMTAQTGAIASC
jgi:hypothetical protein